MPYREIIAVYHENDVERMHKYTLGGGGGKNEIFVVSVAVCVVTSEF